ncbi:hypothetical protein NX059_000646 [Plenodomus lindquistii]|nr:hypothetical protein NX059_000646 [Plenodomus lindquistii]
MVNQRPAQFGGTQRFGASARPSSSSTAGPSSPLASLSRAQQPGLGLGKSSGGGKGLGKAGLKRHVKVQRDTIRGVTKGDIRRLARRGGVKRISATVYDDIRLALKERLWTILRQVTTILEYREHKTITVTDIVYALNLLGKPIYGFDPAFSGSRR